MRDAGNLLSAARTPPTSSEQSAERRYLMRFASVQRFFSHFCEPHYYEALITGRITCLARPSVRLSGWQGKSKAWKNKNRGKRFPELE